MPTWGWILIAAAAVLLVVAIVMAMRSRRRTEQLQSKFGPEYDRTIESADSRRKAESELAARQERREQLDIRPLSSAARERYTTQWQTVQAQFVDDPRTAVASADSQIQSVMEERGYPVEDFEQRAADVSVDHPHVVENYRQGHNLAKASADGSDSTENLRQAMRHFRALFEEIVEPPADQPIGRDQGDTERSAVADTTAPR